MRKEAFILSIVLIFLASCAPTSIAPQAQPTAEFRCANEYLEQKFVQDSGVQWRVLEQCRYGCENERCKPPLAQEAVSPPEPITSGTQETALVTSVIDGDTIILSTDERVRLICVDAPEKGQPYSIEAHEKLRQLVLNKEVVLEKDIRDRDAYDRLLRYVFVKGYDAGKELVQSGLAIAKRYEPDVKYCAEYEQVQTLAKAAGIGMWAAASTTQAQPASQDSSTSTSDINCSSNIYNCGDFKTHAEAQKIYDECKKQGKGDIHKLDQDADSIACESLP